MENEENKNAQEVKSEQKIVKGKSNKKVAIISVLSVIVVLFLAGILYYFCIVTNPVNIYKNIVKNVIDESFTSSIPVIGNDEKIGAKFNIDATLNMDDKEFQESAIVKLINSIDLGIDVQIDGKEEQTVLKLTSTYDKEKMLDVSMFMDAKNKKTYLYAKDLLDSYLEIDMVEEVVTEETDSVTTLVSEAKVKSIIKQEFSNIITEDMCSKEDGAYVLKTTNVAIMSNIKTALENLKTNQEFLDCYENPQEIVDALNEIIKACSTEGVETYAIEIRLYLDLFLKVQKVTLSVAGKEKYDVVIAVDKEDIIFTSTKDNNKVSVGKITIIESDDTSKVEINLNIVDVGTINVKAEAKHTEFEEIEKIDTTKVKKIEELNMLELMEIMSKLEESKLGEVVTEISSMMVPQTDFGGYEEGTKFDNGTDIIF